jgi:hypothetical protein
VAPALEQRLVSGEAGVPGSIPGAGNGDKKNTSRQAELSGMIMKSLPRKTKIAHAGTE